MATIHIDSDQFIVDSVKRNAFQTHLVDKFDLLVTDKVSDIPAKIKNAVKDNAGSSFLEGAKCKFVIFKAKNETAANEDSKLTIVKFIKTVFFIGDSSNFGIEDVVRASIGEGESAKTYFFVKLEMVK